MIFPLFVIANVLIVPVVAILYVMAVVGGLVIGTLTAVEAYKKGFVKGILKAYEYIEEMNNIVVKFIFETRL